MTAGEEGHVRAGGVGARGAGAVGGAGDAGSAVGGVGSVAGAVGDGRFALVELTAGYGGRAVVERVSLEVRPGEVHCLLGPNGAGKTTLFRTALRLMRPFQGRVEVDGRDAARMSERELARLVAYVPQAAAVPFAFTVRDVVAMGRLSRVGAFSSPGAADYEVVDRVLAELGAEGLADRLYTELSGGERQMALIARAFAQEPRYVLMDEPTAALDLGNQARVLAQVRRLADSGIGVLMTTHTPDHLDMCRASGTLLLPGGGYVHGDADELLDEGLLSRAYGARVAVARVEMDGRVRRFCRPVVG